MLLNSFIEFINNKAFININGTSYAPLAYTTYFDECGKWDEFINHGYKMFFVNVSFTELPINNTTGFSPFLYGVFETETPDYSQFDSLIDDILYKCPDALIFPRINISMPRNWIELHINDTISTPKGGNRESLYSDNFRKDGAKLLFELVSHIRASEYSHRIAGYQICGGTTQEWMHHDLFGSYSELAHTEFKEWCFEKYAIEEICIPDRIQLENGEINDDIKLFLEFANFKVAETVEYFAKKLKEYISNEQVVGAFYGYSAFVNEPLYGLHGLRYLIDSQYIDFFSSPCCYDNCRSLGVDWGDMLPVDSLKLHNKLYFVECDIRTNLTKGMQKSRPGVYPEDIYLTIDSNGNKTVWSGPDTKELSLSAIRKAFIHQLSHGSGIWWFDMWGGWYSDTDFMLELKKIHQIVDESQTKAVDKYPAAEVVLFIDEKAYININRGNHLRDSVNQIRVAMGNTGIPFDMYLVEDADRVISRYSAAIFTTPTPSESGLSAINQCKKLDIPYIIPTFEKSSFSTDELREFLVSKNIHCYNSDGNVIYCSNGFLGIHTINDGEIEIVLPKDFNIELKFGIDCFRKVNNILKFNTFKNNTILFEFI